MTQCSVSMTLAHVVEFGERKWKNICDNEFNKLSAGKIRHPVYVMLNRLYKGTNKENNEKLFLPSTYFQNNTKK